MRWKLDYKKHYHVLLNTYCKIHDEPLPSNIMVACIHEGIALGPTKNLQGSVKFYCLRTEWVLKQGTFTPLPMPDRIIKHVNVIDVQ
jgi:hypothetical protein